MAVQLDLTGIGLRSPHVAEIKACKPVLGFLEVHSENYFNIGSLPFRRLADLRADYPVSLHGVGLSLGSADGIDTLHLEKIRRLVDAIDPVFVSEHIAWNRSGGISVPDLLPLPYTQAAADVMIRHIQQVQETLQRPIMVENPSSYMTLAGEMTEPAFIADIVCKTGCKLLLDINNIYVSASNTGFDAADYMAALPDDIVGEIHLAGFQDNGGTLVDAHNHPVHAPVWDLYRAALSRFGDIPTLIEWDNDLPVLDVLIAEAKKADACRGDIRRSRDKVA